MTNKARSSVVVSPISRLAYNWLVKDFTKSSRYDQADPDDENFESSIWDLENIVADEEAFAAFVAVVCANTQIEAAELGDVRYLDLYVDETL